MQAPRDKPRRIKGQILVARARDAWVPAWPQKIRAVLALCGDRYVSAKRISQVILEDYGLTFRLFRLMNSAFFSVHRKDLVSVRYMVVLLGLENLAKAVSKAHVIRPPQRIVPARDIGLFVIARGVFSSAIASALAEELKINQEKATVVSMFRNMGEVISAIVIPDIFVSATKTPSGVMDEVRFKRACGGYDPEGLGLELARYWNMPELLQLAICPARFNLKMRGVNEQRLLLLADLARELILAGLLKGQGTRRLDLAKMAIMDEFGIEDKILDNILFDAVRNFPKRHGFFYRLLRSQGLFNHIFPGVAL